MIERPGETAGPGRAPELLQVEGVAAAVAVDGRDRLGVDGLEQHRRFSLAELVELDAPNVRLRHRRLQALGGMAGSEAEREQHARPRLAADQRGDQLDRRAVAPVQVVEHEHERLRIGDQAQQAADRAVRSVALVRQRSVAIRVLQGREHLTQLDRQLGVPALALVEALRDDVRVQGVNPDAERQLALELGGGAGKHHVPASLRALLKLLEQASLADAGLAFERQAAGAAIVQYVQRRLEMSELSLAPDDGAGGGFHVWSRAYAASGSRFRVAAGCSGWVPGRTLHP